MCQHQQQLLIYLPSKYHLGRLLLSGTLLQQQLQRSLRWQSWAANAKSGNQVSLPFQLQLRFRFSLIQQPLLALSNPRQTGFLSSSVPV
jgi:hypothetical protein